MEIKNIIKSQWTMIKRSKMYYIYIIVVYFLLAFFDSKAKVYLMDINDYIYRYIFQQVCIVFSSMFLVQILINENFLRLYDNFIRLYINNAKRYFYLTLLVLSLVNIVPFIIGQSIALIINYIHSGMLPITLFLANIIIVSIEIIVTILLIMTLNLIFKKNVLVYLIYFMVIFTLLVLNNVYISIPLSMGILDSQEYYTTFAAPLWIGRMILLIISGSVFHLSVRKFINKKY